MPLTLYTIKFYKHIVNEYVIEFNNKILGSGVLVKMSVQSKSTDLVKFSENKPKLPVKLTPSEVTQALELVDSDLILKNREEVKKYLPDILGRVLARIWIDKIFKERFKSNPRQVLNDNGVFLPDDMILEFQKPNSDRPKIIVYEKKQNSNFKIRVVQLQLVMLAGR